MQLIDNTGCFRTPSGYKRITEHNIIWLDIMFESVHEFSKWTNSAYNVSHSKKFKISDYWGMVHGDGYGTVPHIIFLCYHLDTILEHQMVVHHLIIDEQSIQVTEGRFIMFGGHQTHYVPDSDVGGRCMIAGDISYKGDKLVKNIKIGKYNVRIS